jgi:hypothetical protein
MEVAAAVVIQQHLTLTAFLVVQAVAVVTLAPALIL